MKNASTLPNNYADLAYANATYEDLTFDELTNRLGAESDLIALATETRPFADLSGNQLYQSARADFENHLKAFSTELNRRLDEEPGEPKQPDNEESFKARRAAHRLLEEFVNLVFLGRTALQDPLGFLELTDYEDDPEEFAEECLDDANLLLDLATRLLHAADSGSYEWA